MSDSGKATYADKLIARIDWQKMDDLLPAVIQNASSGEVLMLGYMNDQALKQTILTGKVTFFSRSRQKLWVKGETSGNFLDFVDMKLDCDNDMVLVLARPHGPVCHLGTRSCLGDELPVALGHLSDLESVIKQRKREGGSESYTARLFAIGKVKIAQKIGEEGVETALAIAAASDESVKNEAADLLYHLLVGLSERNIELEDVCKLLAQRRR